MDGDLKQEKGWMDKRGFKWLKRRGPKTREVDGEERAKARERWKGRGAKEREVYRKKRRESKRGG